MRGVYLVAAELTARGFVASPTSRSAAGSDLLVTDQRGHRAFSVQVKTNSKRASWWLVSKTTHRLRSNSLLYVFVNLNRTGQHEYYVMKSADVARRVKTFKRPNSTFYGLSRKIAEAFKDNWKVFGKN